ncbi:MAG: hypothetical protein N2595_02065 [bacterium]|nr:hypothetical protein [bacterium]
MSILTWHFPLTRPHAGVPLGNGRQGILVWGERELRLTVGRAGFWDHRGAAGVFERVTYAEVRRLLEAGDEPGLKSLFSAARPAGSGIRPQQMNCGRVEVRFVAGYRPVVARLNLTSGVVRVEVRDGAGKRGEVVIRHAMEEALAWVELDEARHGPVEVVARPAWEFIARELSLRGCVAPHCWQETSCGGFCQSLPADDACALAWVLREGMLVLATALGPPAEAERAARALAASANLRDTRRAAARAWKLYTDGVPRLQLPDARLQEIYEYGLYKQACVTTPGGVPATLQGPFMEEYQLPPWSNDYHFNINLQMMYWPCLATNRLTHLEPLWEMITRWLPKLRENGERFFGVPGALLLPHAVDDRCQVIGTFWPGTIDHGCTAWLAYLAWLHYRYSMDTHILREIAWPLLTGAFNGFYAMLEERECAGQRMLSLPVSVSPEYRGARLNAWGRDASFQLAALHRLVAILPRAAAVLGEPEDRRWRAVRDHLPLYTRTELVVNGEAHAGKEVIALWEGQGLEYSHRHHSHLAGIYPFCTIDPHAPEHRAVVAHSLWQWATLGAGQWVGWSVPWAATICARCGLADAAVAWLHWWQAVYTNYGRGTTHNADHAGCVGWDDGSLWQPDFRRPADYREVMQLEAGLGAVTAVLELLVQCRDGVIRVLPRLPSRWHEVAFEGIRAEGAFLLGARVEGGIVREIQVTSLAGERLELWHGMPGCRVDGRRVSGPYISVPTHAGQKLVIARAE